MKKAQLLLGTLVAASLVAIPAFTASTNAYAAAPAAHGKHGGKAFENLKVARARIEEAKHRLTIAGGGKPVFGGHRANAIKLLDQALAEVNEAQKYAEAHEKDKK